MISTLASGAMLVLMWALTAFRGMQIGNDTAAYAYYFSVFREGIDLQSRFEIGYQVSCLLIGKLTADPLIFFWVYATAVYGAIGVYIFRYSRNPAIAQLFVLTICFSPFTNILRQSVASMIVLFAYQALKKGNRKTFVLLVLLAVTFHTTALAAALLLVAERLAVFGRHALVLAALVAGLAVSGVLSTALMQVLPSYAHYFDGAYADGGWAAVSAEVLRNAIFFVIATRAIDRGVARGELVRAVFLLLLVVSALGYSINLFTRGSQYFLTIGLFELPNILYESRLPRRALVLLLLSAGLVASFLTILALRPEWNHLYPYVSWWG